MPGRQHGGRPTVTELIARRLSGTRNDDDFTGEIEGSALPAPEINCHYRSFVSLRGMEPPAELAHGL